MANTHAHTALEKSSHETARVLTHHLRNEAAASGWPEHIINHMHVRYHDDEFKISAHKNHTKDVHDLEYGTPDSRPTAAMRRFANRLSEGEEFFVGRMMQHMGGDL